MRCILFAVMSLASAGWACAQLAQPGRFEIEQKSNAYDFTVVSMNEKGLALIHQLDKYDIGLNIWEIMLLDSALHQTWGSEVRLNSVFTLIGYEYSGSDAYFLFRKGSKDNDGFHLVRVDAAEHHLAEYDIEPKLDFKLTHFSVVGKSALMGGYILRQPSVFLYDLELGHSKVVPGFFVKNTELIDVRTNHNATFNALLIDKSASGKKLVMRTFDESGAMIVEDAIEIDGDKSILSGLTSVLFRDELMVAGTWGAVNGKTALGIYTVVVDPFSQQQIRYYSFSELNRFLDYYVPKKANRIRARTARRKKAGKLPGFGLHVNAARLTESQEGFLLQTEIYTPFGGSSSNWNYYSPYSPYSSPYGYGYTPYGYTPYGNRYAPYSYGNSTQRSDVIVRFASVCLFDGDGKLIEDTGQKIDDFKLPGIDQVSDFVMSRHAITQVYRNGKVLDVSVSERGEAAFPENTTVPVKLKSPTDAIRSESEDEGAVRHWFAKNLFLWGYESIKGNNELGNRRVFYVNKISVEK